MDPLEQVYAHAPVWAQNAMCSVEGLRIRVRRFPPSFAPLLAEVEERMAWSEQQVTAARVARLRAMLVHAGRHVPYWRDMFRALSFRPERIQHESELQRLPLLTKDIVLSQGSRMRAERVPACAGAAIPSKTSGTTGAGLLFDMSEAAFRHQWAVCWRFRHWHGLARDTWCAQLGGRTVVPQIQRGGPFHRTNVAGRQLLLSGYHLSPTSAVAYLDEIERRQIPWIHGYPSLVVLLADAAHGRQWPWLRWITLASETVTAGQRARIEAGFGVRPVEHYAQTEAVANASEMADGRLHLDDDFSVVELLHDVAFPGRSQVRIVGTSLDNWHTPFIRYDTGDLATLDTQRTVRAPGRALLEIDGRREDYVVLADGTMIGRTDHIFKELTFVREAQIRQREPGAVSIHVVPRGEWTGDEDTRLRQEVARRLRADTKVDIVVEEKLPRTDAGKLRLVAREGDR
ncbi:MAG: hypothetical protein AAF721_14540 [Myxococcota bacterium]